VAVRRPGELAAVLQRAAMRVVPDLEETVALVMKRAHELTQEWIGGEGAPWWPAFAESTTDDPRWVGPLEREGDLKRSIYTTQEGLMGTLRSSDPKIIYSEFGTSHEPPRPMLREAVRMAMREVGITRLRFTLERVMD
jgi:hypothetical protein